MCIFVIFHQFAEWLKPFSELLTGIGTTMLAFVTVSLVYFTMRMVDATRQLAAETKQISNQQMAVTWVDFSNKFDTEFMRNQRKSLAKKQNEIQLKNELLANMVPGFFEDLGTVIRMQLIDEKLTKDTFGFHIVRWWEILKNDIFQLRSDRNNWSLFTEFESIAHKFRPEKIDLSKEALNDFIKDENSL